MLHRVALAPYVRGVDTNIALLFRIIKRMEWNGMGQNEVKTGEYSNGSKMGMEQNGTIHCTAVQWDEKGNFFVLPTVASSIDMFNI